MAKQRTVSRLVVPFELKANGDSTEPHTFEGLAAVWDKDLGNDVIEKGAFTRTIGEWKASGEAMPLLNSHNHFDINAAIGQAIAMKETKDGLWAKWEVIDGPEGDAIMTRLRPSKLTKRPIIGKMSIGFEPVKWEIEQPEGTKDFFDRIRHLKDVNLKEVSLVLFPMAPGASIDASTVKHFLMSANATDPAKLDAETKMYLRKLTGRVGSLLKTVKGKTADEPLEDTDEDEELTDEQVIPPTETDVDDDESDEDDDVEDSADESTDDTDESEETDETDEESDEDEPEGKKGTKKPKEKKKQEPKYQYTEALQMRLRKVRLATRITDVTK